MRCRFWQDEEVVKIAQCGVKLGEVRAARRNEARQFFELRDSDCGLHVGGFQVIADVAVDVFVVIPVRQVA